MVHGIHTLLYPGERCHCVLLFRRPHVHIGHRVSRSKRRLASYHVILLTLHYPLHLGCQRGLVDHSEACALRGRVISSGRLQDTFLVIDIRRHLARSVYARPPS